MAGRRNTDKEQYWRQRLHAWQDSGLSVKAFCVQQQLSEPSFYAWKRKLQPPPALDTTTPDITAVTPALPAFAPVRLVAEPARAAAPLELALAGGRLLRVPAGFDPTTLRQLLAVLEGASC